MHEEHGYLLPVYITSAVSRLYRPKFASGDGDSFVTSDINETNFQLNL